MIKRSIRYSGIAYSEMAEFSAFILQCRFVMTLAKIMKPVKPSVNQQALFQQAQFLLQAGHSAEAYGCYQQLLQLLPKHPQILRGLGMAAFQQGLLDKAAQHFQQSLRITPRQEDVLIYCGIAYAQLNRLNEACTCYNQALELNPNNADVYNYRGFVRQELRQFDAAIADFDKTIAINPEFAGAFNNKGLALLGQKRYQDAIACFDQAIAIKPDYPEAYYNRGNACKECKETLWLEAALTSYDAAIALRADFALAHNNRGLALFGLAQFDAALAAFNQALSIKPDYPEAYVNCGLVQDRLKNFTAALACFERAVRLKPDYAEAYHHMAGALTNLGDKMAALANYEKAIIYKPDYVDAYNNFGLLLSDFGDYPAALLAFDKALALDPKFPYLLGLHLFTKMQICDWRDTMRETKTLVEKVAHGENVANAFTVIGISADLALQRKAAEIWTADRYPSLAILPDIKKYPRREKIRIGYFSMDFRNHAVSFLTAELYEIHDRSRFEIIAFSFGPDTKDTMRTRLEAAFDRFIDVRQMSDQQVAELARSLEIDIAVDLAGYTGECRTGIFAHRSAPIQLSYIGYLGTMGAEYMDYLLADAVLVPQKHRSHYAEKIVYLPSFQVNDSQRPRPAALFSRVQLGLPETGFVFCCFNNNFKITEQTFSGWMRILKSVVGSVLFLYAENKYAALNLKNAAIANGVDASRLIFAEAAPLPEYLAKYCVADLFLDTLPYNAGTTASDALWMGLPVLTCMGEAFASRVAASLLTAIGLPELIATNQHEYEAIAIDLATHPEKMAAIKCKLAQNRLTAALFDSRLFTRHLETAYSNMYERCQADLLPEDIVV